MPAQSKMLADLQKAGKLDLVDLEPQLKAGASEIEKSIYKHLHNAWAGKLYLIWKKYVMVPASKP
jgi:hypothetical protein